MLSTWFNDLARSRRSVFPDQFDAGKKIDDKIIREIITNATWAPDHGRSEPWQFLVFTGEGLKKQLTVIASAGMEGREY